ncbi:MAG: coproporphyrinogen dehydrogenase HemZ [Clostridia bacterium]|nr:coproporphyrinogen dehydrogenase HemZ [Clostridia bacterium]
MSVRVIFEKNTYLNDVQEIPRAFFPYLEIAEDGENYLSWSYSVLGGRFTFFIESDIFGNAVCSEEFDESDQIIFKRKTKYFAKNSLYAFLSKALGVSLPYGSLTGVRPTRMYTELKKVTSDPAEKLVEEFHVLPSKAELIRDCAEYQNRFINRDERSVGLYVNIPFCPTRCSYCSFISTEVFRIKKDLPEFVRCVKNDIDVAFDIVAQKGYKIRSVYVGGGTPTSIGAEYLSDILSSLSGCGCEFTVECGRPDTVDEKIVEALEKNNVTRLSVNPQTFHQRTLDLIGRKHTVEDIYKAFSLVSGRGFSINCDLIAALPQETFEDFRFSLDSALALRPDNITVHTLSIKRGSELNREKTTKKAGGEALRMTDYSYSTLSAAGYSPYYMYRQKNTADNLENTGFCRDDKVCLYNVDTMEESCCVIGCGAGAVSKKLSAGGKITRFSHPKGLREYLERQADVERELKEFFIFE